MLKTRYRHWALILVATIISTACNDPARPGKRTGGTVNLSALCACKPTHITPDDWRIEFKNGSLPHSEPQETTIAAILAWPAGAEPSRREPRSGKELTVFHVAKAYLQSAFLRKGDCDLHMEVSAEPGKDAPRVIIETPGTAEYCPSRLSMYSDLKKSGFTMTDLSQELKQPLVVEITGVAFRDQTHTVWYARGSAKVATLWELHPAVVKLSDKL
jgi:hypothetical protein